MNSVKVFFVLLNLYTLLLVLLHIEKVNNYSISTRTADARCNRDENAIQNDFLAIAMKIGSGMSFEEIRDFTTNVLIEFADQATSYCTEVVEKCLMFQPDLYTITTGDIKYVKPVDEDIDDARTTILKLFAKNTAYLECFATNENQRYEFLITTFMENQNPYPFFIFWNTNFNLDEALDLAANLYWPSRN